MKKSSPKKIVAVPTDEQVEIIFDFTKIDLWKFLDLMEMSARSQDGGTASAGDTLGFISVLKQAFVSSSRPLTVADFEGTIKAFWTSAELFKNPNA